MTMATSPAMVKRTMQIEKFIVAAVLSLAFSRADAAYGVKWTPGDEAAIAGAYFVAENAFEFRMRQPDGKIRKFYRDFESPNLLYGDEPWVGEDRGNGVFRILTNPTFMGGRTAFVFVNGHLRRMVFGRKDYKFDQTPYPDDGATLESLWPKELTSEEIHLLFSTWKGDDGRLRIGYQNPNKGGCLMAEIALFAFALLAFAWARRKWLLVALAGIAAAAAFVGLVMTQSRSAFVSLALGIAVLLAFKVKALLTWRRVAAVASVVLVAAFVLVFSGVGERFTTGLVNVSDSSDALRVNIMKAAPRMMTDSPRGWGLGFSGYAYANWYQAPDEFRVARTLVNSHLTWLVELGWFGRIAYLGGVFALLFFLFAMARRGGNALPLALFALFFAAGFLNSVMEAPTLWLLPCASLALLLTPVGRKAMGWRPAVVSLLAGFMLCGVVLAALAYVGTRSARVPTLYVDSGRVIVNGKETDTWVVDDNAVLGEGFLGRELRMFYAAFPQNPPIGIVWEFKDVPASARHVVVTGKRCKDFLTAFAEDSGIAKRFDSVMFLSPPFAASSIPESLSSMPGFKMLQGELAVRHTQDAANPPSFLTIVPGAELYIPGWMRMIASGDNLMKKQNEQQEKQNE